MAKIVWSLSFLWQTSFMTKSIITVNDQRALATPAASFLIPPGVRKAQLNRQFANKNDVLLAFIGYCMAFAETIVLRYSYLMCSYLDYCCCIGHTRGKDIWQKPSILLYPAFSALRICRAFWAWFRAFCKQPCFHFTRSFLTRLGEQRFWLFLWYFTRYPLLLKLLLTVTVFLW